MIHEELRTVPTRNREFTGENLLGNKNDRDDIKAELKVDLIIQLAKNDYPPVDRDEVYKEIFEQAENFKRYQASS